MTPVAHEPELELAVDPADPAVCPDCGEPFETRQAMKIHNGCAHSGFELTHRCPVCETVFEELESRERATCGRQCRYSLVGSSHEEIIICEHCEEETTREDGPTPQFCSLQCRKAYICEHGNPFETDECLCGREVEGRGRYCSEDCADEARSDRDRPEDFDALLEELYLDEGYSIKSTWRRANHYLDDYWYHREIRDALHERGFVDDRMTAAELVQHRGADGVDQLNGSATGGGD